MKGKMTKKQAVPFLVFGVNIEVKSNMVIDYELEDFTQRCNEKADNLIGSDVELIEETTSFKSASELFTRGTIYKPVVFLGNNVYYVPALLVRFESDTHSVLLEATLNNPKKTFSKVNAIGDCNISQQEFNVMMLEVSNVINGLFYGDIINGSESEPLEGRFPYYYEEQVKNKFIEQLNKEETVYHTYITTGIDKLNIYGEKKYFECFKTTEGSLSWTPSDGINNTSNFDIVYKDKDNMFSNTSEDILSWAKTYVSKEFLDSKYFLVNLEEIDTYSYSEELRKANLYYVTFLPESENCVLPVVYVSYDLGDRYILARGLLTKDASKYLLAETSVDSLELAEDFKETAIVYNEVFNRINEKLKGLLRLIYLEDLESEELNEK